MSTEPTGLSETCMGATARSYLNVAFLPKTWCTYEGKCRVDDLMFNAHNKVCFLCCYRAPLDIPSMLDIEAAKHT